MNLAEFRATSKPIKSAAPAYRPLTAAEQEEYLRGGKAPGDVCHANYLRMTVEGAENVPDGLYLIKS